MPGTRALTVACGAMLALPLFAQAPSSAPSEHADHAMLTSAGQVHVALADTMLPAGVTDAAARLAASPRHREWVMISAGGTDSVGAWIIYPERRTKAPVIVVVHEIFGLSTWVKALGDQLAAQGFIAIVPDLLTGKIVPGGPDSISVDSAIAMVRTLKPEDVQRRLLATANYGMKLPSALPRYGIVGFCWGGSTSFAHAAISPTVLASVVFYGAAPDSMLIGKVHAPVLGLYGGDDARVDATIAPADSVLRGLKRTYEHYLFDGAGHGFARDQAGRNGANLAAIQQAWPKAIAWFRKYLGQ